MHLNSQIYVIYTDFTKVFDRVDHTYLGKVLENLIFGELLLSRFNSYLRKRQQFIKVLGIQSNINNIPSGILQSVHFSTMFWLYLLII